MYFRILFAAPCVFAAPCILATPCVFAMPCILACGIVASLIFPFKAIDALWLGFQKPAVSLFGGAA